MIKIGGNMLIGNIGIVIMLFCLACLVIATLYNLTKFIISTIEDREWDIAVFTIILFMLLIGVGLFVFGSIFSI